MSEMEVLPELKQILGSMIFAADRSLGIKEMRSCLKEVAETRGGETKAFAKVSEGDLQKAIEELTQDMRQQKLGFFLGEVAGGFRFQSDPSCGKWLRQLLDAGSSRRLSWPALETLSIIAYRQPITRAEVESIRGVNVDHMVKTLLEMQLIKIVGRSELAGKPFTYGTTQVFLEYFGLKNLDELSQMNPMLLRRDEKAGPRVQKAKWVVEKIDKPMTSDDSSGQASLPLEEAPAADGGSDSTDEALAKDADESEEIEADEEEDEFDDDELDDEDEDDDDEETDAG